MIYASELVALFRQALEEEWGYIWGKSGQVWTQANQDAATREMTVKYGQRHVGKRVADCSGLFVWAYKVLGAYIYHGSNTIFNKYTTITGAVSGLSTLRPGSAVFMVNDGRRTHIGLYVGGGKVIEAQGTMTGVVESTLDVWDEWGELSDVNYDMGVDNVETTFKTLRKGDTGEQVKVLQRKLIAAGYTVGSKGADGVFGTMTHAAVLTFQNEHDLPADGIVGPVTWAAINGTPETDSEPLLTREEVLLDALEAIKAIVEDALNGHLS